MAGVWHAHGPWLVRYATALLGGDRHAAEDTVQEVMVQLWQHPGTLRERCAQRTWLAGAVRTAVDGRAEPTIAPITAAGRAGAEPAVEDPAQTVLEELTVRDALRVLSSAHRDAVVEVYVRGRPVQEAAGRFAVPVGTIKSRCHYAMTVLRDREDEVMAVLAA